ncbi:hypothetical protein DVK44_11535 [Streptomyces paludis]|uniref:DUF4190 domain-containing protein n=1 Tax=Streptomyces paludis TaxID=2282738 RepID=A0A345HNF7_9ACTN|nr:hypothetical protein DVK44_11535 [Streptomyces paludis]
MTKARNTPARVSIAAAIGGVTLITATAITPMFWLMYGGFYTFLLFLCGIVAIPAGHLGRRRGKRLGGQDRGMALIAILIGWLLLLVSLLLVLAYYGLLAGLVLVAHFLS